jgi:hypothetical protein
VNAPADRPRSPLPPDRRAGVLCLRVVREDRQRMLAPLAAGGVLAAGMLAVVGLPPVGLHGPLHLGIMDPLCGMIRGTVAVVRGQLELAWVYNRRVRCWWPVRRWRWDGGWPAG